LRRSSSALAFAWPGLTLLTLILFYGAFALVDGVLAIIAAVTGGAPGSRWWLAMVGLLGVAAGLVTFLTPGLTALVLLLFIAAWAIATGVFQIIGARSGIPKRKKTTHPRLSCKIEYLLTSNHRDISIASEYFTGDYFAEVSKSA